MAGLLCLNLAACRTKQGTEKTSGEAFTAAKQETNVTETAAETMAETTAAPKETGAPAGTTAARETPVMKVGLNDAAKLARRMVPAEAAYLDGEEDEEDFEFSYFDPATYVEYEVQLNLDGTFKKLKAEKKLYVVSGDALVGAEKAKKLFAEDFKDAVLSQVEFEDEDDGFIWKASFLRGEFRGFAEYDACNGKLIELEIRAEAFMAPVFRPDAWPLSFAEKREQPCVSPDSVRARLKKAYPDAKITDMGIDEENRHLIYAVELQSGGKELEFAVDAVSGEFSAVDD